MPNKMPGLGDAGTVLKTLAKLIKPAVFWIDMDIERRGPGYIVGVEEGGNARERSLTISSKYIASGLRECYKFTLAAATIDELQNTVVCVRLKVSCGKQRWIVLVLML